MHEGVRCLKSLKLVPQASSLRRNSKPHIQFVYGGVASNPERTANMLFGGLPDLDFVKALPKVEVEQQFNNRAAAKLRDCAVARAFDRQY